MTFREALEKIKLPVRVVDDMILAEDNQTAIRVYRIKDAPELTRAIAALLNAAPDILDCLEELVPEWGEATRILAQLDAGVSDAK